MANLLAKVQQAKLSEAEWQAQAAPWRVKGQVYAQPILNYRVKMGGEFVDLTTGKEIKLGDAKDRISAFLRQLAAEKAARQAMPTAPSLPPSPGDATRPERAADALPVFVPQDAPMPVLIPQSAPMPVTYGAPAPSFSPAPVGPVVQEFVSAGPGSQPLLGPSGEGGADGVVVGGSGSASSSIPMPLLLGGIALALFLLTRKGR